VKTLALTPDHSRVLVTVTTTHEAASLLTDETVFWVAKPRLFAGNLSGLGTLVSGSYIEMLPGRPGGKARHEFTGLEDPPVVTSDVPGRTFLVKADRLGSLSLGSPVFFRDLQVGEVLGWDLADMAEYATVHVFVREPFDRYVHDTTRFWNASGVSVRLGGGGIDVQLESLRALLLGGIAFDTPTEARSGAASVADRVFPLYASRDSADAAAYSRKIPLVAYFAGSVRGLAVGADVTLHGLKVGQVTSISLTYDRQQDAILAPVHFEVEPERLVGIDKQVFKTAGDAVDAVVARGMRASLQSASLITGGKLVALEFVPDAPPAKVVREGGAFVVPTAGSGGFEGIETAATTLLNNVNELPFAAIGESIESILRDLRSVTKGPDLGQSLTALKGALLTAQDTLRKLDGGLGPALKRLPDVAASTETAMTNANRLLLSVDSGYGDNTKFHRDLDRLMTELNDTVRSIRAMADLLARHPEALVRGRTDTGPE
jgi:paraquat-inducible protein B